MTQTENLTIRPYARLITMLGDQLIKDETIALIELIKNSYDADAANVSIYLQNFNSDYSVSSDSYITIYDDGYGMNEKILKNAWLNPATPDKLKKKKEKDTTNKGRIIQGEKGIGRFAIFKLGRDIRITTRRQKNIDGNFIDEPENDLEYILSYDFTKYDLDFLTIEDEEQDIFLDDLSVKLESREPQEFVLRSSSIEHGFATKTYGTKIEISKLKGTWSQNKINKICQNIQRLQPIFSNVFSSDFNVNVYFNGQIYNPSINENKNLISLIDEKSVFIVDGKYDNFNRIVSYSLDNHNNKNEYSFSLTDPELTGIKPMKDFFQSIADREIECGSFLFKFYILDLNVSSKDKNTRYYLDSDEKNMVKAHRIYLYRDGIRVMPYGDPEDDWLKLDVLRGTESASSVLGNDQIVGYISISQKENPNLKDKTNREGLIEEGNAREDLVNICQLILRYLRAKPYKQYLIDKKNWREKKDEVLNKPIALIKNARKTQIGKKYVDSLIDSVEQKIEENGSEFIVEVESRSDDSNQEAIFQSFQDRIRSLLNEAKNNQVDKEIITDFLDSFEPAYQKEIEVLESRIERTENLAAIGLSAETAYHDARILLHQINNDLASLINNYKNSDEEYLDINIVIANLEPVRKQMDSVTKLMSDVQRLFPSTKKKKRAINIKSIIEKVNALYAESMRRADISSSIQIQGVQPFIVECTDAVLLQVFINLYDNSLYWLKTVGGRREIKILLDGKDKSVIFSDSGPGVRKEDMPYIFEAFYSGKGEDGKGLGLYIATQLLERYNGSIDIIKDENKKILGGANFLIYFRDEVETIE